MKRSRRLEASNPRVASTSLDEVVLGEFRRDSWVWSKFKSLACGLTLGERMELRTRIAIVATQLIFRSVPQLPFNLRRSEVIALPRQLQNLASTLRRVFQTPDWGAARLSYTAEGRATDRVRIAQELALLPANLEELAQILPAYIAITPARRRERAVREELEGLFSLLDSCRSEERWSAKDLAIVLEAELKRQMRGSIAPSIEPLTPEAISEAHRRFLRLRVKAARPTAK